MKTLVTGGCGFIGSNLVDHLIDNEHDVTVIDNLSSDSHDKFYFNKKAVYYKDDITNKNIINGIFERHKPDYVFHLAAEVKIQNCIENPAKAFNTNVVGTENILEACKIFNIKRVMFSSTSAIYGLSNPTPHKETLQPNCLNMYSYSKYFSEGLFKLYSEMYNVDSVCFRYFNVYGPRQPIRGSYAPVIGIFSRQKKNNEPMTIVGDGSQTRDYVHVFDVVNANILAMNSQNKLNAEIINIGTETSYSVLELATTIGGQYTYVAQRPSEVKHSLADITKAKHILKWKPNKNLQDYLKEELQ